MGTGSLSRTTGSSSRLSGLDTLRTAAIVAVMLLHLAPVLPESLGGVAKFGWCGVDLFFVLSGYLIGSQLLLPYTRGQSISPVDFYIRRAFRILPVYLVVLALYFTVPAWSEAPRLAPLWQYLTFTENFFVDYLRHNDFNHVWSLCIEEHFYLVLPALIIVMMRKPSAARTIGVAALVVAGGIAIRSVFVFSNLWLLGKPALSVFFAERIYTPTYAHLDGLVAGVCLALVRSFRPAWWAALARRGHSTAIAGFAFVALALWLCKDLFISISASAIPGVVVGFPLLALGFALLVASSVSENGYLRTIPVPAAKVTALLAYSLYLIHQSVVHVDRALFPLQTAGRGIEAFAIYAVSCYGVAALLYYGVERPFMRLRDRIVHAKPRSIDREAREEPAL